ncbi:hypothetical protein [Glycomyces buryatensis]|uniref:Uncharacterized protein n=1 Tax=Glycomyces buryatensis TaxID=2570927 RepID=A0A4S8PZV8_9ACTN|nr:hypothetical protein [Glycomyces buryatensis]THV35715.1 hypothetical protein FAB82_22850 [Glycomyces buryatensis]
MPTDNSHDLSALARSQLRPELDPAPTLRVQVRAKPLRQAPVYALVAVPMKAQAAELRTVRLEADDDRLTLTGFDYIHALSVSLTVKRGPLHRSGNAAVDAARLAAALDLVGGETVEITVAGKAITVMAPGCTVLLAAVPLDRFPTLPQPMDDAERITGGALDGTALTAIARAGAVVETGPVYGDWAAVRVRIDASGIRAWAKATYAATVQTVEHATDASDRKVLDVVIPSEAVVALAKPFADMGGEWSTAVVACSSTRWLELRRGDVTSRIKTLATAVEDLSVIGGYLDEPVQASAAQSKSSLASRIRANRSERLELAEVVEFWGLRRTVDRRLLKKALATLPDGEVTLALTTGNRLLLTAGGARTVVSTAPLS